MLTVLSPEQVEEIHRTSLQILEQIGVIIDDDSVLKLLKDAGATIDFPRRIAKIPPHLIEEAVKKLPHKVALFGRNSKHDVVYEEGRTLSHSGGGTIKTLDPNSGEIQEGSKEYLEKGVKIMDALQNMSTNRACIYPRDFPHEVRDLHTIACMLQNTEKACHVNVYNTTNQDYLMRLLTAVAGDEEKLRKKPIVEAGVCPTLPLQYSNQDVGRLVQWVKHGIPVSMAPCPVSGISCPITLAGALAHQNASVLVGILLTQIIRPGHPVIYTSRIFQLEAQSGDASLGSVEVGMSSIGIVQLARFYGIPSDVYGLGTNSLSLDEATAFEKSLSALLPALAGATVISGAGMLGSGQIFSLEQLTIDNEILSMIFRVMKGIKVDHETLAFDVVAEAGPAGDFLKQKHTRDHLREEHFIPRLASRAIWKSIGAKNLIEAAKAESERILRQHEVPPLEKDVQSEIEKILNEADKRLIRQSEN